MYIYNYKLTLSYPHQWLSVYNSGWKIIYYYMIIYDSPLLSRYIFISFWMSHSLEPPDFQMGSTPGHCSSTTQESQGQCPWTRPGTCASHLHANPWSNYHRCCNKATKCQLSLQHIPTLCSIRLGDPKVNGPHEQFWQLKSCKKSSAMGMSGGHPFSMDYHCMPNLILEQFVLEHHYEIHLALHLYFEFYHLQPPTVHEDYYWIVTKQ